MKDLTLTSIVIYPIKSLGGINVSSAFAEERGLSHDRRWMLIDDANTFISQRECPKMALIAVNFIENGFELSLKKNSSNKIAIPFGVENGEVINVKIWDDFCTALHYSNECDEWLNRNLEIKCRLVFMPDFSRRNIDLKYAVNNDIVSFADGYPFLIIGETSLKELNNRLDNPVPMNRFRPNFVFSGGDAFEEDNWKLFKIANVLFAGVKPCGRCTITTIDQESAEKTNEPLKTLSQFRKKNNSVLFGQNLILKEGGEIKLGDKIIVSEFSIST